MGNQMTELFSDKSLDITCPKCGHEFQEKIAGLKQEPKINCPNCGQGFDASDFVEKVREMEKGVDRLSDTIRRLNKNMNRRR